MVKMMDLRHQLKGAVRDVHAFCFKLKVVCLLTTILKDPFFPSNVPDSYCQPLILPERPFFEHFIKVNPIAQKKWHLFT